MSKRLRALYASFEAVPFAKVGGLADVAGALPDALAAVGVDCDLVIPRFGDIDAAEFGLEPVPIPTDWFVGIDFEHHPFQVWRGRLAGGATVYLLGNDHFFGRAGIYNGPGGTPFPDELERNVFFAKGVVELIKCLGFRPDIIHLNDHHTALAAAYVRETYVHEPCFAGAAVMYSIHNLAYQGIYPADAIGTVGLDRRLLESMGSLEFHGSINAMKAAIHYADCVTTVSPSYAREIQTPEHGAGLDGHLRRHGDKLVGILNGIDSAVWDPASDPLLPARYDGEDLAGKRVCKRRLLERVGLDAGRIDMPLIGMVGRLVTQKGVDLIAAFLPHLMKTDASLVVLGSGAADLESLFLGAAETYPDKVGVTIGFDNELAHWITAGADIFLMPSRYEPCGLNQMYSMRYGTIPVVRRTGGLADSVAEWRPESRTGTGFLFADATSAEFAAALGRAIVAWHDPEQRAALIANGMERDFSWSSSAARYRAVYERAIANRRRFLRG